MILGLVRQSVSQSVSQFFFFFFFFLLLLISFFSLLLADDDDDGMYGMVWYVWMIQVTGYKILNPSGKEGVGVSERKREMGGMVPSGVDQW